MTSDVTALRPITGGLSVDGDAHRVAPHNLEAEQGLLGLLLVDNGQLEHISDFLRPEHFYQPAHQRIYDAVLKIIDRGQSANAVILKGYFDKDEGLSGVGGSDYLFALQNDTPLINDARDYARTVYNLHMRRQIIGLGSDMVNEAHEQKLEVEVDDMISQAEARLFTLAETGTSQTGFITLKSSVMTAIEIAEKAFHADTNVTGVTTGLRDLDQKLGGLHNSDLLILAARPSMGKTSLAVNIAYNAAKAYVDSNTKAGGRVGFFSLEMSSDQLATRILADESGISGDSIRKGDIKEAEFRRFIEASQKMSQIPLYIDDTPALSISAVRTRARRLKRQHGLDLLVIDYLQLLRGTGSKQGVENRVLEVSEITRGLKAIAKELAIPVIALSQLSRAVEQREDKRPMLSDLRESGSIEQDSDVVMFIYRNEYYLSRAEPERKPGEDDSKFNDRYEEWQKMLGESANVAEIIIAKQRHGSIGTVKTFFDSSITRFSDLDTRYGG